MSLLKCFTTSKRTLKGEVNYIFWAAILPKLKHCPIKFLFSKFWNTTINMIDHFLSISPQKLHYILLVSTNILNWAYPQLSPQLFNLRVNLGDFRKISNRYVIWTSYRHSCIWYDRLLQWKWQFLFQWQLRGLVEITSYC